MNFNIPFAAAMLLLAVAPAGAATPVPIDVLPSLWLRAT
jgi:hypothetical protein